MPGGLEMSQTISTEAYSLWRGLIIAKEEGIRTLIALGDSMLVIKAMMDQASPRGTN
jgi:ribonuclease HI